MSSRFGFIACALLIGSLSACTSESGDEAAAVDPSVSVDLPPVPSLELLDVPETHPSGAYSVIGLLNNRTEKMNQEIEVSGLIDEIYECDLPDADEVEEAEEEVGASQRAGCKMPHFYINDVTSSPRRLRVTGYSDFVGEQLNEGLRYTIEGRYTQTANGLSNSEGLIDAETINGNGVVNEEPE